MNTLNIIITVISTISSIISVLFLHKAVYVVTGLFRTKKFKSARCNHKYAVLVAARNEETVIGNLIDSINRQDYPKDLVTIFVVADNCTDNTARISRENGAICYERFDPDHRTKGYALQFLVENIRRDYGIESFEAYFLFDADNLLKYDYISRMNESFDSGKKIVTSYRNTKNFGDNWISASYGIHWLRTIRGEHRARSFFNLATRIQGTGFLFSHELIKNGWNYTSLTEDRAFCADAVAQGYEISYNNQAEFYDEQPVDLKIALRQRLRWAKGHLQALVETGPKLLKHIFVTSEIAGKTITPDASKKERFFKNLKLRFMSLDMLSVVYPRSLFTLLKKFIIYILKVIMIILGWKYVFSLFGLDLFSFNIFDAPLVNTIAAFTVSTVLSSLSSYFFGIAMAVYVFVFERKHIEPIPLYKKIWFCFMFPWFDIIGKYSSLIALFKKVEWKAIPHTSNVKIDDIKNGAPTNEKYTTKT